MPRRKKPRYRLGSDERRTVKRMASAIQRFVLWTAEAGYHENRLNRKLARHLSNAIPNLQLVSNQIAVTEFAGEEYRPEYFIRGAGEYPLCCFECKKLPRRKSKKNFMTALSQALLYSALYKWVFLVFYDFSPRRIYSAAFGPGNKFESGFARFLRENHNIKIISIPARAN